MCGRFTIQTEPEELAERFHAVLPEEGLAPSYNAAPTQLLPVIKDHDQRHIELYRWGLIPSWSKDKSIASKLVNARSETVHEKPSFRSAFKNRRCLVLADSFYEWKKTEHGKVPMRFLLRDEKPFAFAGIWEQWQNPEEEQDIVHTFTILTTQPNDLVAPVHDRMPVILEPDAEDAWLDYSQSSEQLHKLLKPYPMEEMLAYPVSRSVNSPRNNDKSLLERVPELSQETLF